jgi:hypothetical protein
LMGSLEGMVVLFREEQYVTGCLGIRVAVERNG